ncbi:MAG TPA: hypothetical protein VMS89_08950, partial [Methanoregulaceae archaeon]|nr:hypothetical protein [Methanoregulaceae archaeon]
LTPAMETKELGFAENLTSTLNTKGADVSGLNAALVNAQSAIQNSNSTAFKDAMKTFNQELQAGIKNGSIPKPGLRQGTYPAIQKNGTFALTPAMETKELGFAENLTSTLNTKGADVSGLNAALVNAQSAIQNSNSTAFKDAMKTFNQELQAQIKSGAIPQSDLPRFSHCPIMGNHPDSSSENHTRGTKTSES